MPRRSRWQKDSWWRRRTRLEKILIGASVIVILIVIALVVLLLLRLANASRIRTCITPQCLNETSEITQRIDPAIDPCEDFYQFSCGTLLKTAHGDEKLGPFFIVKENVQRQIEEMYSEPVKETDRQIVKIAKKLYRTCLNVTAIKEDGLRPIKHSLRVLGGWPVVEGENWDSSTFWWLTTTERLRKLGYFYASFLSVTLETDPEDENRFIFKVSVPDVGDFKGNTNIVNQLVYMTDVAVAFGAKRERAIVEMAEIYDFMLDMRRESSLYYRNEPIRRMQLSEFQKMYELMNWQEIINKIVGPAIRIYEADYLLFSSPRGFQRWFDFLSKTPNRILANYMIWKAIEEIIPYTEEQNDLRMEYEHPSKRSQFCMDLIREKFSPSPIDVMYLRKHLPEAKRIQVQELVRNLQSEFIGVLEDANWMDLKNKHDILERARQIKIIVGAPGDYFDNELLDEGYIDMVDTDQEESFLHVLLKVNRNHQSHIFSQMYSYKSDSILREWSLKTQSIIGDYDREENVIRLPATILQGVIFNEQRPTYLNYGSMGTMLGHHFLHVLGESTKIFDKDGNIINEWSNKTRIHMENKTKCVRKQMEYLNVTNGQTIDFILHQSLGLKLSYGAYKSWAVHHQKEAKTVLGLNYTSDQLFWISAASYFCQPLNSHSEILDNSQDQHLFTFLVSGSILNNKEFSKDFSCPKGSKMNPIDKCEMF